MGIPDIAITIYYFDRTVNHVADITINILYYLVSGFTISTFYWTYPIDLLPERGYTLIMIGHWISTSLVNLPSYYFEATNYSFGVLIFAIFYFLTSALVHYLTTVGYILHMEGCT